MFGTTALALSAALPLALGQSETVLGVYMLHRHGDRTPKILAPTNLTDLGYRQVYNSGSYYRSRYIDDGAPYRISGINTDDVMLSQLQMSAPIDNVLQNSAIGFLQALYPAVGTKATTEQLANGSSVTAPLNGYQLIPLGVAESGSGSEDSAWLQDTSGCAKAEISSNEYFTSDSYNSLLSSTQDFYQSLLPVYDSVFNASEADFFNAYLIWDYINVGEIHNSTIQHGNLLTPAALMRLQTLAFNQQWNLAYNASEPMRAVAGKTLAAQIVQFLNETIEDGGSMSGQKLGIQFNAYGTFSSFFGLADMPSVNVDFTGVTNYASSLVFEMFTTNAGPITVDNYPSPSDIKVRMLYVNATASDSMPPRTYPLFGQGQNVLSWSDFNDGMSKFALGDTGSWCQACGNSTGICEPYATSDSTSSQSSTEESSGGCSNGISPAVNGVIGAMVTLAVVLGLEALAMLVFGWTIVSKKKLRNGAASPSGGNDPKA